jgi:hypothetical protein
MKKQYATDVHYFNRQFRPCLTANHGSLLRENRVCQHPIESPSKCGSGNLDWNVVASSSAKQIRSIPALRFPNRVTAGLYYMYNAPNERTTRTLNCGNTPLTRHAPSIMKYMDHIHGMQQNRNGQNQEPLRSSHRHSDMDTTTINVSLSVDRSAR